MNTGASRHRRGSGWPWQWPQRQVGIRSRILTSYRRHGGFRQRCACRNRWPMERPGWDLGTVRATGHGALSHGSSSGGWVPPERLLGGGTEHGCHLRMKAGLRRAVCVLWGTLQGLLTLQTACAVWDQPARAQCAWVVSGACWLGSHPQWAPSSLCIEARGSVFPSIRWARWHISQSLGGTPRPSHRVQASVLSAHLEPCTGPLPTETPEAEGPPSLLPYSLVTGLSGSPGSTGPLGTKVKDSF